VFRNGDVYEGDFEADFMHGQGNMMLANGSRYMGGWSQGKMHGVALMLFPTGNVSFLICGSLFLYVGLFSGSLL